MKEDIRVWSEKEALMYDPFQDDRDSDVKRLSDKFVTVRKNHKCLWCGQSIIKHGRARAITEVFDGKIITFRICDLCSCAMSHLDLETMWNRADLLKR